MLGFCAYGFIRWGFRVRGIWFRGCRLGVGQGPVGGLSLEVEVWRVWGSGVAGLRFRVERFCTGTAQERKHEPPHPQPTQRQHCSVLINTCV